MHSEVTGACCPPIPLFSATAVWCRGPGSPRSDTPLAESSLSAKVSTTNDPKDFVNGCIRREGTVENGELPLEAGRDVVASPARVDHGRHELDVHNVGEVPWLLQAEESSHLHKLANDLIGHLKG